jgi:hypothetical protein
VLTPAIFMQKDSRAIETEVVKRQIAIRAIGRTSPRQKRQNFRLKGRTTNATREQISKTTSDRTYM